HGLDRALERRALLFGKVDLEDALDAARPKQDGDAGADVALAVLAFEVGDGGEDALFVLQNRFGHLDRRGARRVVGAARLEKVDDLSAAEARPLDDGVEALLRDQLLDGNAPGVTVPDEGDHRVAVGAHYEGAHVLDGDSQFLSEE